MTVRRLPTVLVTFLLPFVWLTAARGVEPTVSEEPPARGENEVRFATYNVEHWRWHFLDRRLRQDENFRGLDRRRDDAAEERFDDAERGRRDLYADVYSAIRASGDQKNWQIAEVMKSLDADVIVFQEAASREDLETFNKRWLGEMYESVIEFPSNTGRRGQQLAAMLKPGFRVIEQRDEYHLEPDDTPDARGGRLFARGPGFLLVESPTGWRFWVGTTHQKSKSGNSVEATQWRNREASRTNEILRELRETGPRDVILLGDFNDELGVQGYETEGGGDVVANVAGEPGGGFVLLSKPLAVGGAVSFGGYSSDRFRSFIDHIVASDEAAARTRRIGVLGGTMASVASDHYPVYADFTSD